MKRTIILTTLFVILFTSLLYAEVAILPYKVQNASTFFPQRNGHDYAKLVATRALLTKDIQIISPEKISQALSSFQIDPERNISKEMLRTFGRTHKYDYILLGTLYKLQNRYISKSIFYSVYTNKIIFRTKVAATDLLQLAQKEAGEIFVQYQSKSIHTKKTAAIDAAFIFDASYAINQEWASIKNAILQFTSSAIDSHGMHSHIYLLPFSERHNIGSMSSSVNSIVETRNKLDTYKPFGRTSVNNFKYAIRYAFKNIRWRNSAEKCVFIIANSRLNDAQIVDQYAIVARNNKIKIHCLSLGKISQSNSELLKRLAAMSRGKHRYVAYHQKIYDMDAKPLHLYCEDNRFFKSHFNNKSWQQGLFQSYNDFFRRPQKFLEEIFYDFSRIKIDSNSLDNSYKRVSQNLVVNKSAVVNNIEMLIQQITRHYFSKNRPTRMTGKVLLQNDDISFWVKVHDNSMLRFFQTRQHRKIYFPLGIIIRKDEGSPYGLDFIPAASHISSEYIPSQLMTTIHAIVKKRDYYMRHGITYPPVWFINAKVITIMDYNRVPDIRD